MAVWQIATGEMGRDYSSLFFEYDVMLLGPSNHGHAIKRATKYRDGKSNSKGNQVYSFANKPKAGDIVLMRLGKKVIGIGAIPSGDDQYRFDETFRCVFGWDLCHVRRVIWSKNVPEGISGVFENVLQKAAFTGVGENRILKLLTNFDTSTFNRDLEEMPKIETKLFTNDSLGKELFKKGISSKNIDDIIKALNNAARLLNWYWEPTHKDRPTEHEVISHVILPIFLGLGWSHQQIAVEWKKVDMAFFNTTPTNAGSCVAILEAKGLGMALEGVINQPIAYMKKHKLKGLRKIIVTDGDSIFVYEVKDMVVNRKPVGYASINNLLKEYIIPSGLNLVNTLVHLQPATI